MAAAGTKLYALADTPDASGVGHIGVIDTATDTVSAQITTSRPWAFDAVIVGSKLYAVDIDTVQVIDTASNAVLSSVSVGSTVARQSIATIDNDRQIVAVGSKVYVINQDNDRVKVIDTATDTVAATITFGANTGVSNLLAVGTKVYVSNYTANTVSVIDTATDSVTATVPVGTRPRYMNVSGTKVYVANSTAGTVSVINTATDTVSSTVTVGSFPRHVDVINGAVFIPNYSSNTVSVIDPATDTVASTLTVGLGGPMEVLAIGSKGYVVTWNGVECHCRPPRTGPHRAHFPPSGFLAHRRTYREFPRSGPCLASRSIRSTPCR
jgi:YVTN family beta-propeller protein